MNVPRSDGCDLLRHLQRIQTGSRGEQGRRPLHVVVLRRIHVNQHDVLRLPVQTILFVTRLPFSYAQQHC